LTKLKVLSSNSYDKIAIFSIIRDVDCILSCCFLFSIGRKNAQLGSINTRYDQVKAIYAMYELHGKLVDTLIGRFKDLEDLIKQRTAVEVKAIGSFAKITQNLAQMQVLYAASQTDTLLPGPLVQDSAWTNLLSMMFGSRKTEQSFGHSAAKQFKNLLCDLQKFRTSATIASNRKQCFQHLKWCFGSHFQNLTVAISKNPNIKITSKLGFLIVFQRYILI
jgi:hypothetical protein